MNLVLVKSAVRVTWNQTFFFFYTPIIEEGNKKNFGKQASLPKFFSFPNDTWIRKLKSKKFVFWVTLTLLTLCDKIKQKKTFDFKCWKLIKYVIQ